MNKLVQWKVGMPKMHTTIIHRKTFTQKPLPFNLCFGKFSEKISESKYTCEYEHDKYAHNFFSKYELHVTPEATKNRIPLQNETKLDT